MVCASLPTGEHSDEDKPKTKKVKRADGEAGGEGSGAEEDDEEEEEEDMMEMLGFSGFGSTKVTISLQHLFFYFSDLSQCSVPSFIGKAIGRQCSGRGLRRCGEKQKATIPAIYEQKR